MPAAMPSPVTVVLVISTWLLLLSPESSTTTSSSPSGCVGEPPWIVSSAPIEFTLFDVLTGLNVCVKATFLFGVPICVSVNEPAAKLTITVPSTKRPVKKYFQLYVPAIGETVVSVTPTAPGPLSVSSLPSHVIGLMSLPVVPEKETTK